MRKITYILICLFVNSMVSQVNNSVLASGRWGKISVETSGVFKIDKSLLEKMGISTNGLNPKTIKIYGNPGGMLPESNSTFRYKQLPQNSIYIKGEEDGVFNNDDYILFYSKGVDNLDYENNTANYKKNIYSNKAYYFITAGGENGKRISRKPKNAGIATSQINTYEDFVSYEKEKVNMFATGQQWLGEDFSVENKQKFTLKFPNGVVNSPIQITTRAVVGSSTLSTMIVRANSKSIYTLSFSAISGEALTRANARKRKASINYSNEDINIEIDFNNGGNPSAKAYLDYIEVFGKKQLKANDKQFGFRSFEAENGVGVVQYNIANASKVAQVWDVTDPINIKSINNHQSVSSTFSFKENAGELREYRVITNTDFHTPKVENTNVKNQNLHALSNIDYLIITNNSLLSEAKRLANYHQKESNLTVKVVLLSEIFNEFSSGSRDIIGIRDFIKHIYDNNTSVDKKLKYVCFFGDASYDFKDRIKNNNNIVPAYQAYNSFNLAISYATDDFYGFLEDNEGKMPLGAGGGGNSQTLDVAVGRIPVSTLAEAKIIVDKILSYYKGSSFGDWHNTITLVADDIDSKSEDRNLQSGLDIIAEEIKANKPIFNLNKIYLDAYKQQVTSGGESYPEAKTAISNAIDRGTLLFDYYGHGGEEGLAEERVLDKPQIQAFNNAKNLPLFVTVTCDFSRFDNPNRVAAGEMVFQHKTGGAASMITTAREIFIDTGQSFNKRLMSFLLQYKNEDNTIAEALMQAKNGFGSYQKLFVFYFGDPAMKLAIPKPNVRITKMNNVDITKSIDTLKALSKVSFEGEVTNINNKVLTNFNGTVSTTIFDKPIVKKTLDNGGHGIVNTFESQESKLYKGKASVKNGLFKFDFIVPKDIKIAYGKGKLSFYANNKSIEKGGANFDVTIGGINPNPPKDVKGPELQLFMNDVSFVDGGNTNSSPNLIIKLSDESGINTSITSVDHDIVAILDGDELNPIVLNDYYETELDDYKNGKVVYQLRNLAVGTHTLKVKAWDTYNNSSEATLNFVVVNDATLTIDKVLNYPNPFVNYTEFWFNHNKPNEPLEVQVQVFTVSGKLVRTINKNVTSTGNLSRTINWNGLDDFGNKLAKGVYVYKLKVKSTVSDLSTEKYEKLVIL